MRASKNGLILAVRAGTVRKYPLRTFEAVRDWRSASEPRRPGPLIAALRIISSECLCPFCYHHVVGPYGLLDRKTRGAGQGSDQAAGGGAWGGALRGPRRRGLDCGAGIR